MAKPDNEDMRRHQKCRYCHQYGGSHATACPLYSQDIKAMKLWESGYNTGSHPCEETWAMIPLWKYLRYCPLSWRPDGWDGPTWQLGYKVGVFEMSVMSGNAPDAYEYHEHTSDDYYN